MKTTMSDFDLLPSSDLLLDENKVRLYHYWNALRNETLEHFMRTKEMIPFSILHKRLVLEFSIDIERLSDLWAEGADLVEGPIDLDADDEIEVDEDVINDFLSFVQEKIKTRRAEDELFRSIVNEI